MGEARRRAQIQQNINVAADQLKDRVCGKCGGLIFNQVFSLKELPPLLSPSGKYETAMTVVGFFCISCGEPMPLRPEPKVEVKEEPKIILVGDQSPLKEP